MDNMYNIKIFDIREDKILGEVSISYEEFKLICSGDHINYKSKTYRIKRRTFDLDMQNILLEVELVIQNVGGY